MIRITTVCLILLLILSLPLAADDGLINVRSQFPVNQTMNRFETAVLNANMKVFTRINHQQGAKSVDMTINPSQVLIFGNPKLGTLLMQSNPRVGLELPLKALAWKDQQGNVWLSYTRPDHLFQRFSINDHPKAKQKMEKALAKFATFATRHQK